jgi:DNA-binding LacI/PurR family transcriptional regulator
VNLKLAMKRNVEALIQQGHRRIIYLGQEWDLQLEGSRYQGYIESMADAGLEVLPDMTQLVPNLLDTLMVGYERTKSLAAVTRDFTAIVASNDLLAVGAIRALVESGMRVPSDVSVTGIDDVEIARLMTPTLTTTRIPKREIGNTLVMMLLDQIRNEHTANSSIEFSTEIIFRESTSYHPDKREDTGV